MHRHCSSTKLGWAWVGLSLAVGLHVTDEALTGFLSVYNPTVVLARQRWSWFPMPAFTFEGWLVSLLIGVVLLLLLSPFAFSGKRWLRPAAYFLSLSMLLNAAGHTLATIFGQTFDSIRFPRPAPGFYSSPVLVVAAVYLLMQLRRTATKATSAAANRP